MRFDMGAVFVAIVVLAGATPTLATPAPTPATTLAPTPFPTPLPTPAPTLAPTALPSSLPTTFPSHVPSESPTPDWPVNDFGSGDFVDMATVAYVLAGINLTDTTPAQRGALRSAVKAAWLAVPSQDESSVIGVYLLASRNHHRDASTVAYVVVESATALAPPISVTVAGLAPQNNVVGALVELPNIVPTAAPATSTPTAAAPTTGAPTTAFAGESNSDGGDDCYFCADNDTMWIAIAAIVVLAGVCLCICVKILGECNKSSLSHSPSHTLMLENGDFDTRLGMEDRSESFTYNKNPLEKLLAAEPDQPGTHFYPGGLTGNSTKSSAGGNPMFLPAAKAAPSMAARPPALVAASSNRSARSAEINWGNTEVVATVTTDTPVTIKVPSGDFDRLGLNFYKNGDRMFISDIKKAVAEINAPGLRWGMRVTSAAGYATKSMSPADCYEMIANEDGDTVELKVVPGSTPSIVLVTSASPNAEERAAIGQATRALEGCGIPFTTVIKNAVYDKYTPKKYSKSTSSGFPLLFNEFDFCGDATKIPSKLDVSMIARYLRLGNPREHTHVLKLTRKGSSGFGVSLQAAEHGVRIAEIMHGSAAGAMKGALAGWEVTAIGGSWVTPATLPSLVASVGGSLAVTVRPNKHLGAPAGVPLSPGPTAKPRSPNSKKGKSSPAAAAAATATNAHQARAPASPQSSQRAPAKPAPGMGTETDIKLSIARKNGSFGLVLASTGAEKPGVFVGNIKPHGPAAPVFHKLGLTVADGLRLKSVGGTDVMQALKSQAVSIMRGAPNSLELVVVKDPALFAQITPATQSSIRSSAGAASGDVRRGVALNPSLSPSTATTPAPGDDPSAHDGPRRTSKQKTETDEERVALKRQRSVGSMKLRLEQQKRDSDVTAKEAARVQKEKRAQREAEEAVAQREYERQREADEEAMRQKAAALRADNIARSAVSPGAVARDQAAIGSRPANAVGDGRGAAGPVSRKYHTEDERIRAEASTELTNSRLEDVKFDFSFGDKPTSTPGPEKAASPPAKAAGLGTNNVWGAQRVSARSFTPASFASKPEPTPAPAPAPARESQDVAGSKRLSGVGGAVSRKYSTEDERIRAEASVEDTNARLENLSFDFSFK